jgi:hypothetical protein
MNRERCFVFRQQNGGMMDRYAFPHQTARALLALCLVSIPLGLAMLLLPTPVVHAIVTSNGAASQGESVNARDSALPNSTVTVTNTNDSGVGSLRDAIASASPGDTVVFSLTLPATIALSTQLHITQSLTINGPGANNLTISGGGVTRVMSLTTGITLNLFDVTIANGYSSLGAAIRNGGTLNITNTTFYSNTAVSVGTAGGAIRNILGTVSIFGSTFSNNHAINGSGGAINNTDTLTVVHSSFYSNTAATDGGGIFNEDALSILNSTLAGNTASGDGGGIYHASGTLSVISSTLNLNSASIYGGGIYISNTLGSINTTTLSNNSSTSGDGGGIYNGGTLTLTNSYLSGNNALVDVGGAIRNSGLLTVSNSTFFANNAFRGGAIWNDSTMTITHGTLSGNSASDAGGGIRNLSSLTLRSTIIANSISGGNCGGSVDPTSQGYNLDSENSCFLSATGDITSTDPLLGPRANNGGPTLTMALLPGSPAIEAANNATCPATDQRGWHRPFGPLCDIGAYERGAFLHLPLILR